jgi:hypothetical protein
MADDVTVDNGSLTDYTVASDDVAGKHYQRVKLDVGGDGESLPVEHFRGILPVELTDGTNLMAINAGGALATSLADSSGNSIEGYVGNAQGDGIPQEPSVYLQTQSLPFVYNGTEWDRQRGDITNGLDVDVTRVQGTVNVADGGGTLTVDGTVTANAGTGPWPVTDNGGSLTVDGTVTATLAGSNANIGNVDVASMPNVTIGTLPALPAGTNNIGDVDVASIAAGDNNIGNVDVLTVPSPLSTAGNGTAAAAHRVTIASDSTGVIAVTDNGGSLTVDGTVAVTNAALTELAAAIDTEMQVDVVGALPAGTNNIGDVDIASALPAGDNNIGNVDVVTMPTVTIKTRADTATLSNVASSATSVTILATNTGRLGCSIQNDSTEVLYLKFGTTASSTSYTVKMAADAHYEVPFGYTGRIDGIWASANGNARVTELT